MEGSFRQFLAVKMGAGTEVRNQTIHANNKLRRSAAKRHEISANLLFV